MTNRLISLAAAVCLVVAAPVATSSAAAGGAHKPVSATHGDCKNDNNGKHNGYDCPSSSSADDGSDNGTGTGTGTGGVIWAS